MAKIIMKSMNYLKPIGNNKAGKYIEICYKAMAQLIDNKYLIGSESEKDFIYERNLLISLAYFVGKNNSEKVGQCYLIGGELNKPIFSHIFDSIEDNLEWINYSKTKLEFTTDYVYPDFLIHRYKSLASFKSHANAGQKLIVEAKSKSISEKEFNRDFFKLNVYLSRLNFEKALYIIVNSTKDEIERKIKKYSDGGLFCSQKYENRLYFLIQENENSRPKLFKVGEELYIVASESYSNLGAI